MKVTLYDRDQTYSFTRGMPLRITDAGALVPMTRWQRFASRLRDRALNATRWWRPRDVCSEIDYEAGSITLARERWSWRRWRWEREAPPPLLLGKVDPDWWRRKP